MFAWLLMRRRNVALDVVSVHLFKFWKDFDVLALRFCFFFVVYLFIYLFIYSFISYAYYFCLLLLNRPVNSMHEVAFPLQPILELFSALK